MNVETSYESDISESWSLIDINLSKESVSVIDSETNLQETYLLDLKKSDNIKLEGDSIQESREIVTDCHNGCHSDFSTENHACVKKEDSDGGSDQDRNDSGDSESIEILDLDGNLMDSEAEEFNISFTNNQGLKHYTYQSDDEESLNENIDNKIKSTCSAVIERKKKLVRHSESPDHTVNSHVLPNGNFNLNDYSCDKKSLKVLSSAMRNLPVYKHYRNNFINTFLSLSVGVVFAGVACIAIGHFLGVHDAGETAVELAHDLKKLQMENVALQARLSQINRVIKQDFNSKFDVPQKKLQETVSCERETNYGPARTRTTNINGAALSEVKSSLKSIQLLSKLQNVINEKGKNGHNEVDFSGVGEDIYDQLNLLNDKKVKGLKLLEDSDKKISKVLEKIIERLSTSQENIKKLYNRLIRLKVNLNGKSAKFFPDKLTKREFETEADLNCLQWCPRIDGLGGESCKSSRTLKFVQPEEFYKTKNDSSLTEEREVIKNNTNSSPSGNNNNNNNHCSKDKRKFGKEGKRRKKRDKNWIKEKSKDVNKKLRRKLKHTDKVAEKISIKKYNKNGLEQTKSTFGRFNDTKESYKKFSKEKKEKPKQKIKKIKKSKIARTASLKENKGNHLKKSRYSRMCSANECYNLTGYWVFKYANGREEFRRHHTLSDWQFERAKGRKEQREEDDVGSWQFRRALARENERSDHRWRSERYRKNYDSHDNFFYEDFSWI